MSILIIIPGWGGTRETWNNFIKVARTSFKKAIVIELPCFGKKPCPKSVWGVDEYASHVKEEIERIKQTHKGKYILLGHSFGGVIATGVVAKNKELVDSLVICGAPIFRHKRTTKRLIFYIPAKIGKIIFKIPGLRRFDKYAKKLLYKAADSPDYDKTDGVKREIFQRIIRQDQSRLLNKIKIPTLVLWGSKDRHVAVKEARKIKDGIVGAKLHIIKKAKHGLHHTHAKEAIEEIVKFVS